MKYRNQTKIKMIGLVEILFYLLNKIIKKRVVPRAMNGFSALNKSKRNSSAADFIQYN